jgi:hypothetical protein
MPNSSKQNQIKPSKKAWISLDSFGRIGTYQWVTANPNKKIFSRATLCPKCHKTRCVFFLSGSATAWSDEVKFIPWISGLRNKLPGGFPAARRLSQLTVCAAERVTGSPLVAASRVTASVFGSSATAELMRLRVANSIVFFLNRR